MPSSQSPRTAWMAILAKAPLELLEESFQALGTLPHYQYLRSPEIGLTMIRGRIEGTGAPFNLGEMTLTRCVVQIAGVQADELIAGFGYVAGRSQRHAELAALGDALLQHPDWQSHVEGKVIQALQTAAQEKRAQITAQVAATRVNFFTLKRGES
ncbi:MAG: phosphonate C-P lyase system protein PhnG [Leptolyngbya sp. SIOISBB]|nr:phosphonate C-P lyase system protein PhnG [Leptolyngbya sp. SIOISBB]